VWTSRQCLIAVSTVLAVDIGTVSLGRAQCTNPDCRYIFIAPFSAGSLIDIVARIVGQSLAKRIGMQVSVENRPGAGGLVAEQAVAKAKPDGSTLLVFDASAAIATTLYEKSGFNLQRDIAPVGIVARVPSVLVASLSLPARTVPDLLAFVRANPGKVAVGSAGSGTLSHLSAELFKDATGANIVHVPYRGGAPALTDLAEEKVQIGFLPIGTAIDAIRSGKVRALAVTGPSRSEFLPDVPTLTEFVPGYDADGWIGVGAPMGTPGQTIDVINKQLNTALADSELKSQLAKLGLSLVIDSPAGFDGLIKRDTEKWSKLIQKYSIKAQ
jgi:tripartite-type tricarboxylate transporter receptor subunit TctC